MLQKLAGDNALRPPRVAVGGGERPSGGQGRPRKPKGTKQSTSGEQYRGKLFFVLFYNYHNKNRGHSVQK